MIGYSDLTSNKRPSDALGYTEATGQKRIRTAQAPSKVVHVRNLPQDCSETDLLAIASPFGRVVNILMLKGKNQALIQMQDQFCATSLVDNYSITQPFIRGHSVFFQYSDREEITTAQSNDAAPNTILLVNVTNLVYNVTIDVLHQVFSKYGPVLKIVIFSKSGTFQSLIQYADLNSAITAKAALDGQHIYVGCCTLRIQFSKLKVLDVKLNNEKSRDYTNPSLPASGGGGSSSSSAAQQQLTQLSQLADENGAMTFYSNLAQAGLGITDASGMGYLPSYTTPSQSIGTTAATAQQLAAAAANPYLAGYGLNAAGIAAGGIGSGVAGGTSVVIVSGLNIERVTPDVLFVLFGVYGDVQRVKILFNKKDTALVQMATSQQADLVISHLNGITLYGSALHINLSKHLSIHAAKDPTKEEESSQYTKDYVGSAQHRYKALGSKNFQHICPPSPTLHLSNVPAILTEESIRALFSQYGTVVAFKYFQNDHKMALVQMSSVTEAVEALIGMHNYRPDETATNLRVSFAKAQIRE